tara:strand:- start:319 stop:525 length:207 start_codon:yes stop_codon:yes gene_type:complete
MPNSILDTINPDANNAVFLRKLSLLASNFDSLELNILKICLNRRKISSVIKGKHPTNLALKKIKNRLE